MRAFVFLSLAGCLVACQPSPPPEDHSHEEGEHSHGAAESLTRWTQNVEWFVEYGPLTVGQVSTFATHVTLLDTHQPMMAGSLSVSLIQGDKGIRQVVEAPDRPGIFTPALRPTQAGWHQLMMEVKQGDFAQRLVVDSLWVYAKGEAPTAADEVPGAISFLKEQAWQSGIHTTLVVSDSLHEGVSTFALWNHAPQDSWQVIAPSRGAIRYASGVYAGKAVKKGDLLFTVVGTGLTQTNPVVALQKAQAQYTLAQSDWERAQQLHQQEIMPAAQYQAAKARYQEAKATYESLNGLEAEGGVAIRAPEAGYLDALRVDNGALVEEGTTLTTVYSVQSGQLEVVLPTTQRVSPAQVYDVLYQLEDGSQLSLTATQGWVRAWLAGDPGEGKSYLVAQTGHPMEAAPGTFTEVQVLYHASQPYPVIPTSALLESYGRYTVMVQLGGEQFVERTVELGARQGTRVAIVSGLAPGDWVVDRGAYTVKMASQSTEAAGHGHPH